jgi:dihydrofolate reductase
MRKLIMWNLVTLDGYFEGEKNWDLSFHELVWGKELEAVSLEQLKSADMLVFGATTYKGMADYWTKATGDEGEVAAYMNKLPKVVCSRKLESADWNNTTIVKDAATGILELKRQGDGAMFVFGSGNLSESLMKAELFDEYRLCLAPVFLGKGRLLFNQGIPHKKLKLLETRPLSTGGSILRYAPGK